MSESSSRDAAWATRREKYGERGHGSSYSRGGRGLDPIGGRALSLVLLLHIEETLSEGQCCAALDIDRVDFRKLVDGARAGLLMASHNRCKDCGGSGVEMYVGWENSVTERPCSICDGTGRDPSPPVIVNDKSRDEQK